MLNHDYRSNRVFLPLEEESITARNEFDPRQIFEKCMRPGLTRWMVNDDDDDINTW